MVAAFPRPGRTLKAVLASVAALAILGAVVVHWAPGGAAGLALYRWLAFEPSELFRSDIPRVWTLITSGLLTFPQGISHALWSLVGLYFLSTDLERRWGGARLLRFYAFAVLMGNLAVLAGALLSASLGGAASSPFDPPMAVGPLAAIVATAIAWARENAHRTVRLMFVLPITGRMLFWFTIGVSALSILFLSGAPEGALAPVGGIAAGLLFGGTPSPARAVWLRLRLGSLRRRSRGGITVEDLLRDPASPRPRAKRGGKAPELRIVQGGLDDDLKNRKPPKDKRYLN